MLVKALVSFCGKVNMMMGEIRDISDSSIVKDLLRAKYVEEVSEDKPKKTARKQTPKGG